MRSLALLTAIALIGELALARAKASSNDREAIKIIAMTFQDAWNRHDMKALTALVARDVDFVTAGGRLLKNQKEFEEHHVGAHQMQFKQSVLTFGEADIKFISPKIALVHFEWAMKGDKDPDGTPRQPRQGIFTWVVKKENGKWLIIAAHNTNSRARLTG